MQNSRDRCTVAPILVTAARLSRSSLLTRLAPGQAAQRIVARLVAAGVLAEP